ncbi:MAG: ABC transporter permease [Clostridiales bacterium]|nr:ABC transporter permease [Clostridiales bacterium]
MAKFILKRLLMFIPMVLVLTFLIFGALELTPGDALTYMLDSEALAMMPPEQQAAIRESLGLNDPFFVRYFKWLGELLGGNFGYCLASGRPIKAILGDVVPATLELSVAALLISTFAGSALGLVSALRRGSIADNALSVAGVIGLSIPQFFFGMLCILLFALKLGWLPVGGRLQPWMTRYVDHLRFLILPACVLGISMTAGVMRYSRAAMLDTMNKDYIKTARSKGLPEWRVNIVHGFRVSLTPIIVLVGFRLPTLIGGSVVIESIFQWPGVGMAFKKAVTAQNYPLVMIIALLMVLMVLIASLLIDMLTRVLDPRVKLQ